MYWTFFEWASRIGWTLQILVAFAVGIVGIVVAIQLTRRRVSREAAWLLALGWLAWTALSVVQLITDLLVAPMMGWSLAQWISYATDLLQLCCFAIMGVGLVMLRPPVGGRT